MANVGCDLPIADGAHLAQQSPPMVGTRGAVHCRDPCSFILLHSLMS